MMNNVQNTREEIAKAGKISLKEIVLDFARGNLYFQIRDVKTWLRRKGIPFRDDTLKRYLYRFKKENRLFSAGRGWYSTLSEPFPLDTTPVEKTADLVHKQFSLLEFSCWSTAQLQSYFHHLQGKSLTFLYAERDALHPLFEFLGENNLTCYLNPTKRDLDTLSRVSAETFVLRPSISEEPGNGYFAPIEKILVDLCREHEKLQLFDAREYTTLFESIATRYRIDMAKLMRYANRREIRQKIQGIIHQWQNKSKSAIGGLLVSES